MTITLVQHASSTSGTATFGSNTTIGNCLIACVQGYGASSITRVTTGSSRDNWASLVAKNGGGQAAEIWIDPACTVSKSTVTFTASGATQQNIQAYEFSGMGNAPVLDVDATFLNTGLGSTSWSSGATASAAASDLRIGMYAGNTGSAYVITKPTSPWLTPENITSQFVSHEAVDLVSGYYIPGTSGTITFAATQSTNSVTYAVIAAGITPGSSGGGGSSAGSFLPFFS